MAIDREGQLLRIDYGDRIYFDAVIGIAGTTYPIGTAGMPSDVIANVITICAARDLFNINVHGALTLGAAMEHYCFFGNCHMSIIDVVTLNGQDVDSSRFECLVITGAQGGTGYTTCIESILYTVTGFRGLASGCGLHTSIAIAVGGATDNADFVNCHSIQGTVTATIGAPDSVSFMNFIGSMILTVQTAGAVILAGYKGDLEIDGMTGGTLDIYANGADITINADCIGTGIINIFGDARVTDNHGAGTTVNDYGSSGYKELTATGTTTNAYADALAIDARLYNELTIKIVNTDGANSLNYRVLLRPEYGVADQMIQPEDIILAPADYDFVNIDHKWGQIIVQVEATVVDSQATFSVYAICNKQ